MARGSSLTVVTSDPRARTTERAGSSGAAYTTAGGVTRTSSANSARAGAEVTITTGATPAKTYRVAVATTRAQRLRPPRPRELFRGTRSEIPKATSVDAVSAKRI